MFSKILIANRGEIACRIARTCRRLGIGTVAVYSDADARAQHVRVADEGRWIGGARPADSYLRGERIIEAALASGAQAVHPGFGFLSENADFAEAVAQAGLVFIGPSAASMRRMGSKAGAKVLMQTAGVPVVPGYTGEDQDPALLAREAERIGCPLMIKAAHGGGGKGMRVVRALDEFAAALESCQREARGAFGRDRVLLERYVERPRHIEIQIFGDHHGEVIHLNERECSAQRRYQKVIEESPSPFLTPELRTAMGTAAVQAGRAIDYANAGTVEFIVGPAGDFYFMEINTRLQVEHPVTEMVTGMDLVELQLAIAAGGRLADLVPQRPVPTRGHAIEVRLDAEDPARNVLPGSGRLEMLRLPDTSERVRIDSGAVEGDLVTVHYDPMIAKLIVHEADRGEALALLRRALAQTVVVGPKSNVEFLERLVRHPAVVEATIDTGYLDQHLDEVLPSAPALPREVLVAVTVRALLDEEAATRAAARTGSDPHSPWAAADGWRHGHPGKRLKHFLHGEALVEVSAHGHAGDYTLDIGADHLQVRGAFASADTVDCLLGERALRMTVRALPQGYLAHDGEQRFVLGQRHPFAFEARRKSGGDAVRAPMPGRIVALRVDADAEVAEGQEVVVMEAMKMELTLRAPRAGKVAEIRASVGEFVEADSVLVRLAAESGT
ncbi:MAG: ATP-grasp domain-containing protein [Xanthomonadales bacterium]|nr:ATP-grasp domain-containing protein [Xanthomonadales bacterium]